MTTNVPELPKCIRQQTEKFCQKHWKYGRREYASGACSQMSFTLQNHISRTCGVDLELVFADYALDCSREPLYDAHQMLCYAGTWIIDVTARQFWDDVPYPLIERVDEYGKRFARTYRDANYWAGADSEWTEYGLEDLVQSFQRDVATFL